MHKSLTFPEGFSTNKVFYSGFMYADGAYWDVPEDNRFSLEATAYALLALVKAKELDKAGKVVHWLSMQNYSYGSHESTQVGVLQTLFT